MGEMEIFVLVLFFLDFLSYFEEVETYWVDILHSFPR